jgi:hypothetical protein
MSILGIGAAEPVFTDYSIGKIDFSAVSEKDGVTTGTFNKQTVVSGISITPAGTISAVIEGTQDGVNWIKIWETGNLKTKTDFGLTHGIYANYADKAVMDTSMTYAWTKLRITSTPATAGFTYELYGYETNLTGRTVEYDKSFGSNGVKATSYYKDDRYKNVGNHTINQWSKGDVVSATDGIYSLTVKFAAPAAINGFAFAHRSGDTYYERWNNVKFQASVNGTDWIDLVVLPANAKDTFTFGDLAIVSIAVENSTEYSYARILGTTVISVGVLDVYAPVQKAEETSAPETTAPAVVTTAAPVTTEPITKAQITTAAPATASAAETTKTPETTASPVTTAAEGGGCKSAISICVFTAIIPAAVLTIRKKK